MRLFLDLFLLHVDLPDAVQFFPYVPENNMCGYVRKNKGIELSFAECDSTFHRACPGMFTSSYFSKSPSVVEGIPANKIPLTITVAFEREREMFYLTTHSTHFIYGYMASDIW